jgi:hypothetical protein
MQMSVDESKWVKLVAKLNAMTQDGKLLWEGPKSWTGDNGRRYTDYVAKYKDKAFRARKAHSGRVTVKVGANSESIRAVPEKAYLGIVDDQGDILFPIPDVVGLDDLFESILYQRSGVKEIIDDLLKDEE